MKSRKKPSKIIIGFLFFFPVHVHKRVHKHVTSYPQATSLHHSPAVINPRSQWRCLAEKQQPRGFNWSKWKKITLEVSLILTVFTLYLKWPTNSSNTKAFEKMKRIGWRVDSFLIDQKALNTVTYTYWIRLHDWLLSQTLKAFVIIPRLFQFQILKIKIFFLYFMDENKYSVPEHKTLLENVQVINTVSVKISGRKYTATLSFGEFCCQ